MPLYLMELHTIKGNTVIFKDNWMRNMAQRKMLAERRHESNNECNKGNVQNVCPKSLNFLK